MMTLSSRPYAGAIDLEPLIDLLLLCRTIAGLDPWPPIRAWTGYTGLPIGLA
jgi:hypothetical protein